LGHAYGQGLDELMHSRAPWPFTADKTGTALSDKVVFIY